MILPLAGGMTGKAFGEVPAKSRWWRYPGKATALTDAVARLKCRAKSKRSFSGGDVFGRLLGLALRIALRIALLLALDALVNLFPVHGDVLRSVDADANLVSFNSKHGDRDVVADHHRLTHP